jgi:hypothetical protein
MSNGFARGECAVLLRQAKNKKEKRFQFLQWRALSFKGENILNELAKRFGSDIADVKRRMDWITKTSRERRLVKCELCANTGGYEGRLLDWVNEAGVQLKKTVLRQNPLPSDEDLKTAITTWTVMCLTCRRNAGLDLKKEKNT